MKITKKNPFTGITNTQEIDVTEEQIERWYYGEMIQVAMPALTADEREFIMTGITAEDWENL